MDGVIKNKLRLTDYILRYPRELCLQSIGGILYNTVVVFGAVFLGRTIDAAGLLYNGEAPVSVFYFNLFMFLGITVIFQLARFVKRFYMRVLVNAMNNDIRVALLDNLLALSMNRLSAERTGDIMSRMTGDVDVVGASVKSTLTEVWDTVLLMLSYFIVCMTYSPRLTLLASLPIPVALFIAETLRHRLYALSKKSRLAASRIAVHLRHHVTGVALLRLFGLEDADREHFSALLKDQYKWQSLSGIFQSGLAPLYILIANIGVVLVLGMGGAYVVEKVWTVGMFTAYLSMFSAMVTRTNIAAKVMNTWHGARASWDRICEKLADEIEDENHGNASTSVEIDENGLLVRDLSFRFPFAAEDAVENISFEAKNGQIIGITGAVGSGKSALAGALSGLYAEGRNPRIAYMDSSQFIFSDDVGFNITMSGADQNTSRGGEQRLDEAVSLAELREDISSFDNGLDTRLMERGLRVSGGQKQRITLARAWYADCRVVILDDPFSAVDIFMERRIMQNIRESIGDRIVLLFSHRLTSFALTDAVIVMEKGQVAESGTHDGLCGEDSIYKRIYEAQAFMSAGMFGENIVHGEGGGCNE